MMLVSRVYNCVCAYVFTGDVEGGRSLRYAIQTQSILCVTLTKHTAALQCCRVMDLTLTENCGPLDYLSASLALINFHPLMCVL